MSLLILAATACQQSTTWTDPELIEHEQSCDGDAQTCVIACCDSGYSCQRGLCVNGSSDSDRDGHPAYRDCDDYAADVYPGAPELCDEVDNNCDGEVDEGVTDESGACTDQCTDRDGDGHLSCVGDCDDDDPAINPDADEVCDFVDNDCDGEVDEGFDLDEDLVTTCGGDCDDTERLVAPVHEEVCDGLDNDCSGVVDDGVLCGERGECVDGRCRWVYDALGEEGWQGCGHDDGHGGWCASDDCERDVVMFAAPRVRIADLSPGAYVARFRLKIDRAPTESECPHPLLARLRVNDRDATGTDLCQTCDRRCMDCETTCEDCYFGGANNVRPNNVEAVGTYQWFDVPFAIDDARTGHRIGLAALREQCPGVEVCIDRVQILEE